MRDISHQDLEILIGRAMREENREAVYWSKTPSVLTGQNVAILHLAKLLEMNGYSARILDCNWNPNATSPVLIDDQGCSKKELPAAELKKQIEFSILYGKYKVTHAFFSEVLADGLFSPAEIQAQHRKCNASDNGAVKSYIKDLFEHDSYETRLRKSQKVLVAQLKQQENHEIPAEERRGLRP